MTQEICPSREELFKEYEYCQTKAQSLESTIWQTGTAMSIGWIGTLIVMANHPMNEQPPWPVAAVVGIAILSMSILWGIMAGRWWSIQHACFLRMRHIETELGLFQTRYLQYLDAPQDLTEDLTKDSGPRKKYSDDIQRRVDKRKLHMRVHQSWGIQGVVQFILPIIILVTWFLYVCSLLLDP